MALASAKLVTMMLVIAISMAVSVLTGQARVVPQAQTNVQGQVQVQLSLSDALECFSSIRNARGCRNEVEDLILSGEITSTTVITPTCCTTIAGLGQNCWSKLVPLNPFLPAAIGRYCAAVNEGVGAVARGPTKNGAEMGSESSDSAASPAEMGADSVAKSFFWGA